MLTAFISRWAAGRVRLMICQKRGAGYGRRERDGNSELIVLPGSGVPLQCEDELWERGQRKWKGAGPTEETGRLMKMERGARKRYGRGKGWWMETEGGPLPLWPRQRLMKNGIPSVFPRSFCPYRLRDHPPRTPRGICRDLLQTSTSITYGKAEEVHVQDVAGRERAHQPA